MFIFYIFYWFLFIFLAISGYKSTLATRWFTHVTRDLHIGHATYSPKRSLRIFDLRCAFQQEPQKRCLHLVTISKSSSFVRQYSISHFECSMSHLGIVNGVSMQIGHESPSGTDERRSRTVLNPFHRSTNAWTVRDLESVSEIGLSKYLRLYLFPMLPRFRGIAFSYFAKW